MTFFGISAMVFHTIAFFLIQAACFDQGFLRHLKIYLVALAVYITHFAMFLQRLSME